MSNYVPFNEQLIVEIYVRNLASSLGFYESIGFDLVRVTSNFAELVWDDSRLFLEQDRNSAKNSGNPVCNIRIMVPDVDDYWNLCQHQNARVLKAIGDRHYGLRDFTVVSPDGIGLRFATRLHDLKLTQIEENGISAEKEY